MICSSARCDGVNGMRLPVWAVLVAMTLSMPSTANESAANAQVSLSISQTDDNWELTVPVAHATVVVPKGELRVEKLAAGGATASPRYFYLVDRTDGETIFAGWLESSERVKNVDQLLQSTWLSEQRSTFRSPTSHQVSRSVRGVYKKWKAIHLREFISSCWRYR